MERVKHPKPLGVNELPINPLWEAHQELGQEVEIFARPGTTFDIIGLQCLNDPFQITLLDAYIGEDFLLQGPLDIAAFKTPSGLYVPMQLGRITDEIPFTLALRAFGNPSVSPMLNFNLWGYEEIVAEEKLAGYGKGRLQRRVDDENEAERQRIEKERQDEITEKLRERVRAKWPDTRMLVDDLTKVLSEPDIDYDIEKAWKKILDDEERKRIEAERRERERQKKKREQRKNEEDFRKSQDKKGRWRDVPAAVGKDGKPLGKKMQPGPMTGSSPPPPGACPRCGGTRRITSYVGTGPGSTPDPNNTIPCPDCSSPGDDGLCFECDGRKTIVKDGRRVPCRCAKGRLHR